jgi:hypothetical protein
MRGGVRRSQNRRRYGSAAANCPRLESQGLQRKHRQAISYGAAALRSQTQKIVWRKFVSNSDFARALCRARLIDITVGRDPITSLVQEGLIGAAAQRAPGRPHAIDLNGALTQQFQPPASAGAMTPWGLARAVNQPGRKVFR